MAKKREWRHEAGGASIRSRMEAPTTDLPTKGSAIMATPVKKPSAARSAQKDYPLEQHIDLPALLRALEVAKAAFRNPRDQHTARYHKLLIRVLNLEKEALEIQAKSQRAEKP